MRTFCVALLAFVPFAVARTFTVFNQCPYTVWPAIYTDPYAGTTKPSQPTGWAQGAQQNATFEVPDNWHSGRIWARRNCDFSSGTPGPNSCLTGGCNGGLECASLGGTGVPPATLTEFTFQGGSGNDTDFYDVSLVNGYNIPLRITPSDSRCSVTECAVDLGPNCPPPLKGPFDPTTKFPIGCTSACNSGKFGDPNNSSSCCTGSYATACPSSGVPFYSYFKSNCPKAYAYAYDDSSSLMTCPSGYKSDYLITLCP